MKLGIYRVIDIRILFVIKLGIYRVIHRDLSIEISLIIKLGIYTVIHGQIRNLQGDSESNWKYSGDAILPLECL